MIHLREVGVGAIVNVTAMIGKTSTASSLPTSVSRATGMVLTKAMSKDLEPDNIRVNTVCIGFIRSDQMGEIWKIKAPKLTREQYSRDSEHRISLGGMGETEEAAKAITFLFSDAASHVAGTSVNIDDGFVGTL